MRGLIFEVAGCPNAALFDIAGQTLLVRQLQWLRDNGITRVVIEVAGGQLPSARRGWLLSDDPLLTECTILPTEHPLGVRRLALRAGIPDDEVVIALPADVLAQGELADPLLPGRYAMEAPSGLETSPVAITVATCVESALPSRPHDGWALRVGTPRQAHALSCAALLGSAPGILIHGAEVTPGVWLGRGARVADDAQLRAPVLIGPDARVFSRAEVGPRVTVGRASIIERDAQLGDCSVAPNTLVGEATRARGAYLCEGRMTTLSDGTVTLIDDPLVLTRVQPPARVAPGSRLFGLLLLALLLIPWLLAMLILLPWRRPFRTRLVRGSLLHEGTLGIPLLDRYPALFDVASGLRSLLGPTDLGLLATLPAELGLPAGAIDILPALAPTSCPDTQVRLLRWYALHKARSVDFRLWLHRFR